MKYTFLFFFLSLNILSAQDWKFKRESAGIKVWTAERPNSNFKMFKAEGVIEATLDQMEKVFQDINSMHLWYDNVKENKVLKKISDNEGIISIEIDLPWPFTNRLSVLHAKMKRTEDTLIITTKHEKNIPLDQEGFVWVDDIGSYWNIIKINSSELFIKQIGYLDPEGNIPAWLASSGLEKGPLKTIIALRSFVKSY